MLKLTLKSLRAHTTRLLLTLLAITLGVAFVATAFVLADSLTDTFDEISEDVGGPIDATVRNADWEPQSIDVPPVDIAIIEEIEALPEVDRASAALVTPVFVTDPDGNEVEAGRGPPNLAYNFAEGDVGPLLLVDGSYPGPGEVVIDVDTIEDLDLELGDTLQIGSFVVGAEPFELVGVGSFGEDNATGPKYFFHHIGDMQRLVGVEPGQAQQIDIAAAGSASSDEVVAAVTPLLGDELEALTTEEIIDEFAAGFRQIINIFTGILLGFAGVALVVSIFVITNTFAIVLGQRVRELGLLRAVGASAGQVTASVIGEAVVVGLFAWILGLLVSLGISRLLLDFISGGSDGGGVGLDVAPRTLVITFIVGIVITVIAALAPAVRAGRIPPIAALRSDGTLQGAAGRKRLVFGGVLLALGALLTVSGLTGEGSTANVISTLGGGAVFLLLGTVAMSPLLAGPAARVIGSTAGAWLVTALGAVAVVLGLVRLADGATIAGPTLLAGGASLLLGGAAGRSLGGRIGQGTAVRNPRRTATTAAALMIGLSLITSVTVVTESIRSTFTESFENAVRADYVVSDPNFNGFPSDVAADLLQVEGVTAVASLSETALTILGDDGEERSTTAFSAPPTLEDFVDIGLVEGDLSDLTGDTVVVIQDTADELGLTIGGQVTVRYDSTGDEVDLAVVGINDDASVLSVDWVISAESREAHVLAPQLRDDVVAVATDPAVDAATLEARLDTVRERFPQVDIQTSEEYADSQEEFLDQTLRILQVFLGLAVVIALIGIANTMALSVVERTREIGLLRAVGSTRHQVRQMIRWEAVIVALFGGLLGTILGVVFGAVMVTALPESVVASLVMPWQDLVVYLTISAIAGLAAAYFPARRAARLDILEAISHE